jgi:hypothetical protein
MLNDEERNWNRGCARMGRTASNTIGRLVDFDARIAEPEQ